MQKKLLLFGGTGFVGSHVARKALERGYKVIVATRSGAPETGTPLAALAQRVQMIGGRLAAMEAGRPDYQPGKVSALPSAEAGNAMVYAHHDIEEEHALEFVSIDAASRDQVFHLLHDHSDTTAIVSCIGALTRDYDEARMANGDTNTNIAAGVCHPKLVPVLRKLVVVSAEPFHKYAPSIIGSKYMLKGYFHGKAIAEKAVLQNVKERGVVLRPGFIYGTRYLATIPTTEVGPTAAVPVPLWLIGKPLDLLLTSVGGRKLLVPPVNVEVVAETAVRACDWAGLPELGFSGLVDVYKMHEVCEKTDPTINISAMPERRSVDAKPKDTGEPSKDSGAAAQPKTEH